MKATLEILKIANDVVTTSPVEECPYEACPGLEWDANALEG